MGLKLNIEIEAPLTADDRDLLTGISIMVLAIANREVASEHFPDAFPKEGEEEEEPNKEGMN